MAAKEREKKCTAEIVKRKQSELQVQRETNRTLTEQLIKMKGDLETAKDQQAESEKVCDDLRRENKNLKARLNQLQHGIGAGGEVNSTCRQPTRKAESISKSDNEFEVENLLNDEFREGKRYFLVKWKGYDISHSTWEQQSNLKCPKILKKYMENKKKC